MLQLLIEIILDMKQKFLSWLSPWLSEKHLSWLNEHLILIVIIVVATIIWSILASIYSSRKLKKRAESLKEFLPQQLIHSLPNENLISKFKKPTGVWEVHSDHVLGCFFVSGATNLMEGNMGSIDFVTYDYKYSEERGAGPENILPDKTFRGTAIFLQSDQLALPSFRWGPVGLRRTEKIQPGKPPKKAGFKQCPTCGSLDVRRGAEFEWGRFEGWCDHCKKSIYKMNKEKVHNLFELVSIVDLRGLTVLASNTQLLLYRKSMVPAEKYQEFKEKALKIFHMFQSASQNLNEHA